MRAARPSPPLPPRRTSGRGPLRLACTGALAVLLALVGVVTGPAGAAPGTAPAAAAVVTSVGLEAPGRGWAGETVRLRVRVQGLPADDPTAPPGPVAGAEVVLERADGDRWRPVGRVTTGADGTAESVVPLGASSRFRAVHTPVDGPAVASPVASVHAERRPTRVTLHGRKKVVDEKRLRLRATVRVRGRRVAGVPVQLLARSKNLRGKWRHGWKVVGRGTTSATGRVRWRTRPRTDTRYRARVRASATWRASVSRTRKVRNLPPGEPVRMPVGAPQPRYLPPQPRATTRGADARVQRIPDPVWNSMVGRSWHTGCPVGRAGLRLVTVNYWGYDGYRHRGELVVAAPVARKTARVFTAMHRARFPVRAMYRVDRFGWSRALSGANDMASMASGNTSAFNCRHVVGRPGVRSPHASGRSLDLNPWENPYRSPQHGWVPNEWWRHHTVPRITWRSRSAPVVRLMRRHGWSWSYGLSDLHHFDG